ncbi:unnamed protein product [Absidia cylindrospora]
MTVIDLPVPNDSITNKQATQKGSLYHTCRYILNALSTIHSLQRYLTVSGDTMTASTPMSRLWQFCRQGTSLCIVFNTLRPDTPIPIDQQDLSTTARKPKPYVYHFIIACREQLHFNSDTLFTLKDIFNDDTNGFVRVVNILKRVVDMMESEGLIIIPSSNRHESDTTAPKDTRDKIVIELLETERKYVQDLEILQSYMRQAKTQEVLPPDTLHQLFGNLHAMVDCQLRFLMDVEEQAVRAPQDQRFGQLFLDYEDDLAVYEPFCANFQTAQSLVCREQQALEKLSHILSPSFELPSTLIKPVQRLCKYPLLMKQLVKTTPSHWPFYDETKQGLEAIQRVTAKVNETRRRQENLVTVRTLKEQVDDWPTSDIDDFGPLLLHDKFMVYRGDPGRELIVYLFEKCLFVCREEKDKDAASSSTHGKDGNKKSQKKKKKDHAHGTSPSASTSSPSSSTSASGTAADASKAARLGVRGRILMSRVAQVNDTSQEGGAWTLQIFWSEKYLQPGQQFRLDSFTLKCRHQEQLQLWESSLNRLIKQMKQQAREAKAAAAAAAAANAANAAASLQLSSPETPMTPMSHTSSRLDSTMHNSHDEEDEVFNHDEEEAAVDTGSVDDEGYNRYENNTQPGGMNCGNDNNNDYGLHPPATPLSRQHYNNAALGMTLPPLPRFGDPQFTSYPPSPNSYTSSSYNSHMQHSISTTEAITQQVLNEYHHQDDDDHFDDDYDTYSSAINTPKTPVSFSLFSQHQSTPEKSSPESMMMTQQHHYSSSKPNTNNNNNNNSISTRLRSQSSPNIHPSQINKNTNDPIPSVPAFSYQARYQESHHNNNNAHRFDKRKSNGDQDIRRPLYASFDHAASSSSSSSSPPYLVVDASTSSTLCASSSSTKVKVHHLGSIYVLVVPLTIDYKQLVERIERKMKCDSATLSANNTHALAMTGLKYKDEEGDLITMGSNDDLQMGFELRGANNTVNFYIV